MPEPEVKWPEKPHGHRLPSAFSQPSTCWRPPEPNSEPYGYPFRTCSYCGSIHPEDLYNYLKDGVARLTGSDWKYGWPHKFYVEGIPNPQAGKRVQCGVHIYTNENWERVEEPEYMTGTEHTHAKWYNEHLEELSEDAFGLLAPLLKQHTGIEFLRDDGRLKYRAPYPGYQP